MTVAPEAQELKTDPSSILQSGSIAVGLIGRIFGCSVRQTQLAGGEIEMAPEMIMHIGSEAMAVTSGQPHIFIEIETQPAAF
jgi:hypothetical protein